MTNIHDISIMPPMSPRVYIGTSGWNYPHWAGVFYPKDVPQGRRLEWYATTFPTVEVNATFYRLPPGDTFRKWKERTPEGFLWSVKANRFITHIKRLNNATEPLARFYDAASRLGEKLGCVLFQLPPTLSYDDAVFKEFCTALDRTRRTALEVRHHTWIDDRALSLMQRHNIAFCISDTAGRYVYHEAVTADFVYIRLHGSKKLYASDYTDEELYEWARKITSWERDTFIYFDNDAQGYAPRNAMRLRVMLGAA